MLLSAEQVTKLYGDRIRREQKSRTAEQASGNQTYAWSI